VGGIICLVAAFRDHKPNDLTVGSVALLEVLLLVQLVMVLIAPAAGNPVRGDALEFWMYLIAALLIPPLAIVWSIIERVRWSNAVLAVAAFAIAVMVIRMQQIWVGAASIIGGA
jgi:lysylphosphatidylglycerol synthetase-like protein (DUF2156 family)